MKKTYLIKDQGKGLIENLTPDKLFDIASGGLSNETDPNSGGSRIIEVTYDELVNLKNTSSLVKGQNYLLTDYMTTYTQPVTNVNKSSGVIEPLILTAVSENQISNVCRSTLYPQDIVYYGITGDIGNGYDTEGFTKGKIYRRIDTLRNNDIGTDWRHVKYDRDGVDKLLFKNYNGCSNNVIKTYYLFDNVVGNYFNNNTIGDYFSNNTVGHHFNNNTVGYNFNNNIIGDYFSNNTIRDEFGGNTIGDNFYSNTVGIGFFSNTVGNYFSSNTVGNAFIHNTVGNNFGFNTTRGNSIFNTIGDSSSTNIIGYNFSSNIVGNNFISNTIGDSFISNTIGDNSSSNTIGSGFDFNTIGDSFNSNIIGDDFYSNTTGFNFDSNGTTLTPFISQNTEFRNNISNITSSTEIQNQNIDVVVFKSPNSTVKQRYYDDSNNLVINNL